MRQNQREMPYSMGAPLLLSISLFKKKACRTIIFDIQTDPKEAREDGRQLQTELLALARQDGKVKQ